MLPLVLFLLSVSSNYEYPVSTVSNQENLREKTLRSRGDFRQMLLTSADNNKEIDEQKT